MKKEILAGLIVIVAIASIAIFTVTPSMSTSFEIDGKQTSNEMELLFVDSGDDNYQEYKYVSYKIEKNRISASAGGAEVYEAGWLPEFLEKWIDKLFEFLSGTDPKELGEDLYEKVDEEYPHYDKAGEPGSTPAAGEGTGKYAGPRKLIIDGKLSEEEKIMLDAMEVGKIVFGSGRSTHDVDGDIVPGVKSTSWAFIRGIGLYFHEENNPKMVENEPELLGQITFQDSKTGFPQIACNLQRKTGYFREKYEDQFTGRHSHKFTVVGARSGNEIEYIIEGLSREFIEKNIGDYIKIGTLGGEVVLNTSEIKEVEIEIS